MTTPAGRVLAGTVFAKFRPIEDDFNPATYTVRGVGLVLPNRLQHFEYQRRVNVLHRQVADDGINITLKRVVPLLTMLGIAPTGFVRGDVLLGTFLERCCLGFGNQVV